MYFYTYALLCLCIVAYLYFHLSGTPMPGYWNQLRVWGSWAFILWAGYGSVKVIVDCLLLSAKGEMSQTHVVNGILLALLHNLPVFLMSVFLLREGYAGK